MGHGKMRHDRTCLNCGANVEIRYCSACGQENVEPKETVGALVGHFFADITHYDGKFFKTTGQLLARPGFLSKEYTEGRRNRYLHPIRMYVFTSAVFFLVFFATFSTAPGTKGGNSIALIRDSVRSALHTPGGAVDPDSAGTDTAARNAGVQTATAKEDSEIQSIAQYDSVQRSLPPERRDQGLERKFKRWALAFGEPGNGERREELIIDKFLHTFPYLLFISLPLYALYLKLLYARHKQFYYADHAIFLIHLYIFTFILLLLCFGLEKLHAQFTYALLNWIIAGLLIYGIYYAYAGMRRFYGQGRAKTFMKFTILNVFAFVSLVALFALFFAFTIFRV